MRGRAASFAHAWHGVVAAVRSQPNARIHLGAALVVVAAGFALEVSRLEWGFLVLAMAGVWSAEAVNTAVEILADVVSSAPHPAIGRAKDVAAGAVLLAAVGAVVVGVLVFGPRLLHLVESLD